MASGIKIIDTILNYSSALFGLASVGTSVGPLSVPPIMIILASLGLTNYKLGTDNDAEETEEEFKKRIQDSLNDIPGLKIELQKQYAGLKLATDKIERLEELDLTGIAEDDLRRPYFVLYQYLKGKFNNVGEFNQEILNNQKSFELLSKQLAQSQADLLEEQQHLIRQHHFELMQKLDELIQENQGQLDELIAMRCDLVDLTRDLQTELFRIRELLTGGPRLDLELFKYDPKNPDAIQNPYHYRSRRTPLFGREKEIQELWEFLQPTEGTSGNDVKWWLWTGAGGAGKSRLALELCLKAVANGYDAGFWSYGKEYIANQWEKWEIKRPTLIVIDYVSSRPEDVRKAILALYGSLYIGEIPVRFLLLERPLSEERQDDQGRQEKDEWWTHFWESLSGTENYKMKRSAFKPEKLVKKLSPLNNQFKDEALWDLMCSIWDETDFVYPERDETLVKFDEADSQRRPLFAIFASEAIAAGKDIREWSPKQLTHHVLQLEVAHWRREGAVDEEHVNLVVYATICGGVTHNESEELKQLGIAIPGDGYSLEQIQLLTRYNSAASVKRNIPPYEPSILGELLVLERMQGECDLKIGNPQLVEKQSLELFEKACENHPLETIGFLLRCSKDQMGQEIASKMLEMTKGASLSNLSSLERSVFYFRRGEANKFTNRFNDSINDFTRGMNCSEIPVEMRAQALSHRAYAYSKMGDHENDINDLDTIIGMDGVKNEMIAEAIFNRGFSQGQIKKYSEAISDFDRALLVEKVTKDLREQIYFNRAFIYSKQNEYLKSVEDYSSILEMENISNQSVCFAHFNRAVSYRELEQYDDSISDFTEIIQNQNVQKELYTKALLNRGIVFGRNDENQLAIDDYSVLVRIYNASVEEKAIAFNNRGRIFVTLGFVGRAIEDFGHVLDLEDAPINQVCQALINRGSSFRKINEFDDAINDFTQIIEMDNSPLYETAQAFVNRGAIFTDKGLKDEAINDLRIALESSVIPPNIRMEVQKLLDELEGQS